AAPGGVRTAPAADAPRTAGRADHRAAAARGGAGAAVGANRGAAGAGPADGGAAAAACAGNAGAPGAGPPAATAPALPAGIIHEEASQRQQDGQRRQTLESHGCLPCWVWPWPLLDARDLDGR